MKLKPEDPDSCEFQSAMERLALKTGLEFDGGDNRLHWDSEPIHVFANDMTEEEYDRMDTDMFETEIRRGDYMVYAWNDVGGFKYWRAEGEHDNPNYIQITVSVEDPFEIDAGQLMEDARRLYDHFAKYDNADYHDFNKE